MLSRTNLKVSNSFFSFFFLILCTFFFAGLRLIEVLTSELPEHLKSQMTDAERERLDLAFYSRLVSTGLLRSFSDKDSTSNISHTVSLIGCVYLLYDYFNNVLHE